VRSVNISCIPSGLLLRLASSICLQCYIVDERRCEGLERVECTHVAMPENTKMPTSAQVLRMPIPEVKERYRKGTKEVGTVLPISSERTPALPLYPGLDHESSIDK
jgi:hypothetical protein